MIHFVPAGDVEGGHRSLPASMEDNIAPIIKSGRAAFGVVIKGYIERLRPEGYAEPELCRYLGPKNAIRLVSRSALVSR